MVDSKIDTEKDDRILQLLLGQERIEGKINRMGDRLQRIEDGHKVLLDVVTGSQSGAHNGLVVRTRDLESAQQRTDARIVALEKRGDETHDCLEEINEKLDKAIQFQDEHPPFLYLIRYKTGPTIKTLLIVFFIFVILWTTGALSEIASLFGL